MIIIKIKGGLGNQLFQYSFGKFLSEKNKDILKLDIDGLNQTSKETKRGFLLDKFNIESPIASNSEVRTLKYPFGFLSKIKRRIDSKVLRKFHITFEPSLLKLRGNIYLDGYFQSEKYFKPIEGIIKKELTLKDPLSSGAEEISNQIKSTPNSVSIHVRRGDYITNKSANAHHGTCTMDYYNEAISYMKEKLNSPTFFVFSDDIQWVKENLKTENVIYVSNPNLTECEELILMSKCEHNIIANSTFSWWGAWLNSNQEKIVIAPKQWTNKASSNKLGILPETWIQI